MWMLASACRVKVYRVYHISMVRFTLRIVANYISRKNNCEETIISIINKQKLKNYKLKRVKENHKGQCDINLNENKMAS